MNNYIFILLNLLYFKFKIRQPKKSRFINQIVNLNMWLILIQLFVILLLLFFLNFLKSPIT